MKSLIAITILLNIIAGAFGIGKSRLVLHLKNENRSVALNGDQCGGGAVFDNQEVSCACLTGLWVFYREDCALAHVILGATNGQCFDLNFQVRRASLISPSEESRFSSTAAVFDQSISSIGGKFTTTKGIPSTTYFVPSGFPTLITTGEQSWRIPHKNICMKPHIIDPNVTNYCLFEHSTHEEHRLIDEECSSSDEIIPPTICAPYLNDDATDATTCIDIEVVPRRTRRDARASEMRQQGRVFLDAVTGLTQNGAGVNGKDVPDADENHGLNVKIDRPIMNSEIWNFMTFRAQVRLGIRDPKVVDKSSLAYSPSFEFLDVAKQIQQKACPDHYVTDDHYDISIGAFESLLKNHLGYTDAFLDFSTSERIMDALNECLLNISTYPFLERIGKRSVSCNGSSPISHGSYEMYGQVLELNLGSDQGSRENEPIVETVWKVFIHAHSACFPYFKTSYNDHHRFTTVMLPLFTNEVNEMWTSVEDLQPDIYTGFLGDAVDLMDSVAYCAMFSRLDSAYPWDLPRPKKGNARRKRQVSEGYTGYECMEDYDARNVCPIPEITVSTPNDDYDLDNSGTGPISSTFVTTYS